MKKILGGAFVVGTIFIAGVSYFIAAGPIDETELGKAGYTDCALSMLTCPIHLDATKRAFLKANVTKAASIADSDKRLEISIPVMKCVGQQGDGVLVVKSGGKFAKAEQSVDQMGVVDFGLCRLASCAGSVCASDDPTVSAEVKAPSCAWRPKGVDPSLCRKLDGSDPGDENTMMPGQWVGAGCVQKFCYVLAGETE